MSDQDATNPVAEEEHVSNPAEGVAEAENPGGDETLLDDDGNPIEADDDSEEIEHEGVKHKLPKALAKEFREGTLRQADYTRKTQELATQRQGLDTERAALVQQTEAQSQTIEERATLHALNQQLQAYQSMNWQQYAQTYGSDQANIAMAQWRQIEAAANELKGEITRKEDGWKAEAERNRVTGLQQAEQQLVAELPGYGPDLVRTVTATAQTLGFVPQDILETLVTRDGKPDIRMFKALAEFTELRKFKADTEAKIQKAQTAAKQAAVTPASTVRANSGAYKPGLNDDLPQDEWLRRRNAQKAKAKR